MCGWWQLDKQRRERAEKHAMEDRYDSERQSQPPFDAVGIEYDEGRGGAPRRDFYSSPPRHLQQQQPPPGPRAPVPLQREIGGWEGAGGGMMFGRDASDEKALRRAKQDEYRRQLDAAPAAASEHHHNQLPRHNDVHHRGHPIPPSDRRELSPDTLASHPSRSRDPPNPHPRGGAVDYPYHPTGGGPPQKHPPPAAASPGMPPSQASYTGRVHRESSGEVDKAAKRRQQEQYRLQLEQQAREVAERKEQEKKMILEEERILMEGRGGEGQASPVSHSKHRHETPERNGGSIAQPHRQAHPPPENVSYRQHGEDSGPPPVSPGRHLSPNKAAARNRLLTDVYGGRGAFPGAEAGDTNPGGKISLRGADANASKKKAAMREQQKLLEQQASVRRHW